jgi:tetratricopeptide (TPR) repeat protein
MARIVAALSRETLAGMDAKMDALAKLEALSEEVDAVLARRKSNSAVRRAVKAWRRGNIPRAGQLALAATEADDTNAQAFHVLAMALERMGHLHKALVTYERAVELDPNDPDILIDLGMTAWNLKMKDGAVKMFEMYINARPDSPLGYNNLGSVQGDMGKLTTAIETLRSAIYRMPSEAILWNSLATVLAEEGRVEESLVFYNEAVKLEPDFGRPHHNLGYAYQHLGRLPEALEAYDNALARMSDPGEIMEAKHSRSICLIGMGRLEEGFREYEIRNDERFRAYVHHMVKAPLWRGEPLDGKRLLVTGEQGLGDEFMFANILPDLQRAVGPHGKLQIAVDRRLHSLFQRSFPDADIGNCDDRMLIDHNGKKELRFVPFAVEQGAPDFFAPMGTPLHVFRKRLEDFPHEAFLKPDPERVAHFRELLQANGPGPYVGICWRSMLIDTKRAKYYSALDMWGPILKTPGVRFVNIQYGDCADELAHARELHGVEVQTIEGLDLKNDIDGAAALSAALDLAISAPTAAAACAGSVGTEVWFLTAGRTWPQLGTDEFPWYRKSHVFSPAKFGDWNELIPRVAERLAAFAAR